MVDIDPHSPSDMKPSLSEPFLFLLPPEVREIIYSHLPRYTTAPKPNAVYHRGFITVPPLLLTNRLLYKEYLPYLYRRATLVLPVLISVEEFPIAWTPQHLLDKLKKVRVIGLKNNWGFREYPKPMRPRRGHLFDDVELQLICADVQDRMPEVNTLEIEIEIFGPNWGWLKAKKLEDVLSTWQKLGMLVIVVLENDQEEDLGGDPSVLRPGDDGRHFDEVVKSANEQRVEKGWQDIRLEVVGTMFRCRHGWGKRRRLNYPYLMDRWPWEGTICWTCREELRCPGGIWCRG